MNDYRLFHYPLSVTRNTNYKSKFLPWIFLLLWIITFASCTERRFAAPAIEAEAERGLLIRVLLLDNVKTCKLTTPSSFAVLDARRQRAQAHFDRAYRPIDISISRGKITIAGQFFADNEIIIQPDAPGTFGINGDRYRGQLKLIVSADGKSFDAINLIGLEQYLAGVVGAEMYSYWELAALQSQAIAARTYCLYMKKRFGGNRTWDVKKTQASQVYLGLKAETARTRQAVNETSGQVLVCRQNGTEDIFPAYYSSSCGGHTENSKNVFGDSFEPLAGVVCPYCEKVAKPSNFFWRTAEFDKTDVTTTVLQKYPKLKYLGEISRIVAARQSNYGKFSRLTLVKLVGSSGKSGFLRAEDFRLSIDPAGRTMKSTIYRIIDRGNRWSFESGRGFGHGVGMCQSGAQAMAREGKTARQILSYYYPGSKIKRITPSETVD